MNVDDGDLPWVRLQEAQYLIDLTQHVLTVALGYQILAHLIKIEIENLFIYVDGSANSFGYSKIEVSTPLH